MNSSAEERIAESFNEYFSAWDIRIAPEDAVIGIQRVLTDRDSGWRIAYRIDPDDSDLPVMEFYAVNRFTDDRHVRIWADGNGEHLDAISEITFVGEDDDSSGRSNAAIAQELRERGLY